MYEPIHELTDYYDGPRSGIAELHAEKCQFISKWLDVHGDEEDIFEVTFLSGSKAGSVILAHAKFRRADSAPTPAGQWPKLEVLWQPLAQAPNNSFKADA